MRLDISIREKLVVYFLTLGVFSIIIVGIYSYSSARKAIIERSFDQLTSIREVKKERLKNFFYDRERDINLLSNSIEIKLIQKNFHNQDSNYFENKIDEIRYVRDFFKKGNYYTYLMVCNQENEFIDFDAHMNRKSKSINRIDSLNFECIYNKVIKYKTTIIQDYVLIDTIHTILIGTPTVDEKNNITGAIIMGIPDRAINNIMYENSVISGVGKSGESYLVGDDFLMRSQSRFIKKSILEVKVETNGVKDALKNKKGTKEIRDYRGINVLSSFCKIEITGLNWVIVAEIDFKEVMDPIFTIRNDIILMSSFITLILFFVSFFISKKISDPIVSLNNATMEIAKGKLVKQLPIISQDEIGELTDSFNRMNEQIQKQTKELLEREKRLQHFYDATKDGIILHDSGIPVLVNQALSQLTNFSIPEIMNLMIGDIISVQNAEIYKNNESPLITYETICYRKDESHFPVEVQENKIEFEGKIINSTVIRDISERIESQNAIQRERQKRLTSFFDGQENERKRLSRELHDGLGQVLIGIKMRIESIRFKDIEKDAETVDFLKDITNQTIHEVRRMSNDLVPSVLRELGLLKAINQLCNQLKQNHNISVFFDNKNVENIQDDRLNTYIYRVIQEAVNNALKHGKATEIRIILNLEELYLRLIIEDNGIGFDINSLQVNGNGLYNMRERINLLGGTIKIFSNTGQGTVINAKIPIYN